MPIIYRVNDPVYGLEPAVSDGTIAGTGLLSNTSFGGSMDAGGFEWTIGYDGGVLFRVTNDEYQGLWTSNGDYKSTELLTTDFSQNLASYGAEFNGGFIGPGTFTTELVLPSGGFVPGDTSSSVYWLGRNDDFVALFDPEMQITTRGQIVPLSGSVVFQVNVLDPSFPGSPDPNALILSDGTPDGTQSAPSVTSEETYWTGFTDILEESANGERVLFVGVRDEHVLTRLNGTEFLEGRSLFSTDGTSERTIHLDAIDSFSSLSGLARIGGFSFLKITTSASVTDGNVQYFNYDQEIWQTNGHPDQTWKLFTLSELYANIPEANSLDPTDISDPIPMGDRIGVVVTEKRGFPHKSDLFIFDLGADTKPPTLASDPIRFEEEPKGPFGYFEGQLIYSLTEGANDLYYRLDVDTGETELLLTTNSVEQHYPINPFYELGDSLVFVVGQYVSLTGTFLAKIYGWEGPGSEVVELGSTRLARWDLTTSELTTQATIRQDGDLLYFNDGYYLKVTDGTQAGTQVLDEDAGPILGVVPYAVPAPLGALQKAIGSDFDANGYDDILFFNESTRTVGQFQMPSGDWRGIGTAGIGWEARGTGLFDSDDTSADILWFNVNTRAVGRFDMEGGVMASWSGIGRAGFGWEVMGSGDFNGDGTDDILWFNETTNTAGQYSMDEGSASWAGIGRTGSDWEIAGIGDLNGDAIDDILWWNEGSRTLGQFQMNETGKVWSSIAKLGTGYKAVDTGDFDGDGTADILVFNPTNRKLGMFDLGSGSAQWASLGTAGSGWAIAGTGDFDNSGTDDILWRHSDGRVGQYQMDGSQFDWVNIGFAGAAWEVLL